MATKLSKPIAREVADAVGGFKPCNLIVELRPPNIISIREKRRKATYDITVGGLYTKLVSNEADKEQENKKAKRKRTTTSRGLLSMAKRK